MQYKYLLGQKVLLYVLKTITETMRCLRSSNSKKGISYFEITKLKLCKHES